MLSVDYRDIGYFLRLYAEYLPVREQFGQQYIKLADIQRFIETSPDLQDQTPESWNRMRLKCKKCKKTDNPHYADGICEPCVKSARHWEMKQLYESGFTLAQIGERYDVTRERARQLISRAVQLETDHKKLHFVHIDQSQVMDELKRENKRRKADKIDPMENELDATLVKSFDLYGRQCYLCHKPFNRKLINLSVHYGDGDSSNTEENNIYPICDDCKTRV